MKRNFGGLASDQGSSIVEIAVSLAVLMTVLFGVLQAAMMLYTYHYVAYAARQGSRYAMVRGSACDPSGGMDSCPSATGSQIQTHIRGLNFSGFDSSQLNVNVTWAAGPQGGACNTGACNDPGDQVKVTATYPFNLSIPFVPAATINMSSTSEMVIAQ
jgi:hypothetical protein